ncbi:hypothetical protein PsorP6_018780 [Peronosclerospora sorghi]|nr:hypothetical protein PsorP6_018780 [Peronosclerospora sorghi]
MKFILPQNAFPPIKLPASFQQAIVEETDTVVRETVAASEGFRADGSGFDSKRWKLVRKKDGIMVYRQSKKFVNRRGCELPILQSSSSSSQEPGSARNRFEGSFDLGTERHTRSSFSSGMGDDTVMERMRPHGVTLFAVDGTVDGTVDDFLFGSIAPTDDAWKLRSSHINDRLNDVRLLATLRRPTPQDPYRLIAVKWFAKEIPVLLTGIVHQRDFIIVESSGFTRDSKGERLGYFLMHSVTLPEIPDFSHLGMIRGVMSFCCLSRQDAHGKVNIFSRGFLDPRGDMPRPLAISITADSLICCVSVVDYAYIKKLRWLLKHSRAQKPSEAEGAQRSSRCEACGKNTNKFLPKASGSGAACQICHRVVCTKCSVMKKITLDVSDKGAVQQFPFCFCKSCLMKAKELSSRDMALESIETSWDPSAGKHVTPRKEMQRRDYRANSIPTL